MRLFCLFSHCQRARPNMHADVRPPPSSPQPCSTCYAIPCVDNSHIYYLYEFWRKNQADRHRHWAVRFDCVVAVWFKRKADGGQGELHAPERDRETNDGGREQGRKGGREREGEIGEREMPETRRWCESMPQRRISLHFVAFIAYEN